MISNNWVFPGQGSQQVGMGKEFLENNPQYSHFFQKAEEVSGKPLRQYIWEQCPEFAQTDVIQPAIYALECAMATALLDQAQAPAAVAGHSLGQYAALFTAGIISFEQGLEMLQHRSAAMQKACEKIESGMIACIFANPHKNNSEKIHKFAQATGNYVANFNSYDQIVLSGLSTTISSAAQMYKNPEELAKHGLQDLDIIKAIPLKVAGAYHCPLMSEAAQEFAVCLEGRSFSQPKIPVICNLTAKPIENIKDSLVAHIYSPVLWQQTIEYMQELSPDFLEIGPGNVLTKLLARQRANS